MGRFSGEFRVSYFPLIDRVNGVIIYMQKFRHAHWLRARQLIPNIAESWNFFSVKSCARRVTSLSVEQSTTPCSTFFLVTMKNVPIDVNYKPRKQKTFPRFFIQLLTSTNWKRYGV